MDATAGARQSMELQMQLVARYLACTIGLMLLAGIGAVAESPQDRRWCEGEDEATPEQRIAGCSAVIRSGRERGEKLADIFNDRGIAHRLKGDVDRAIGDYSAAIRLNPKSASIYNNRGVAYDKKGDYDRAIADYDQAIRLHPLHEAYFNRGNAHLGRGQYDRAIDDYDAALKLKADFAPALDNRCWARALVGLLKPALADCNEALRMMPNNADTLDSRAFIFLKMTHFDAAVSDYDAALRIDPKLAFALYGRGLAKMKNGDPTGEQDLTAAKALQADIAEEYARYGMQAPR
jgi:tetratricopeptide (TPR) repeat protein